MNHKELMEILEIDNWEQLQYYEQFLTLMDYYNKIDHEILMTIFSRLKMEDRVSFIEYYFEDLMTGIPDDEISVYKIFSSVKSMLLDIISVSNKKPYLLDRFIDEFLRFLRWITEEAYVKSTNIKEHTIDEISIYEALILSRIELLNQGKFQLEFPEGLYYEMDESSFENLSDIEEEYQNDDNDVTLIDPDNPVIIEFE